jgi:hypothetical protein
MPDTPLSILTALSATFDAANFTNYSDAAAGVDPIATAARRRADALLFAGAISERLHSDLLHDRVFVSVRATPLCSLRAAPKACRRSQA